MEMWHKIEELKWIDLETSHGSLYKQQMGSDGEFYRW